MRTKNRQLTPVASIFVLVLAPLALGAKGGCTHAVVGDDGDCQGEHCGEAGTDGDTGGSAGSGGSGTGGAHATGGSSGSTATGGAPAHGGSSGSTTTGGGPANGGTTSATGGGPAHGGSSGNVSTGGGPANGGSSGTGGQGATCGGLRGSMCADGQFCSFAPEAICGFADATGTCEAKPEACDEIYAPVCGCDGRRYSNDCDANMHGVSVQSQGECAASPGDGCGGLLGTACADGEFCDFAEATLCGSGDQTGTCQPIPSGCTKEYDPVCGCDDHTYGNACDANAHGVSVAAHGECEVAPSCGGIAAIECAGTDQYCDFPLATHCGSGDQSGTCKVKPQGCTTDYTPVCGCDDHTYSNACSAAAAGVSIQATGECPAT
jgi:hypothetical protein